MQIRLPRKPQIKPKEPRSLSADTANVQLNRRTTAKRMIPTSRPDTNQQKRSLNPKVKNDEGLIEYRQRQQHLCGLTQKTTQRTTVHKTCTLAVETSEEGIGVHWDGVSNDNWASNHREEKRWQNMGDWSKQPFVSKLGHWWQKNLYFGQASYNKITV